MTKRDYEMIAAWMRSMRIGVERHGDVVLRVTFGQFIDRVADDLAADNSRFNKARFVRETGGSDAN